MITHFELGGAAFAGRRRLKVLINKGEIQFAGNRRLKIYGTLTCSSGKRIRADNRVFFPSEAEARSMNFRPCGHCMRKAYLEYKKRVNPA